MSISMRYNIHEVIALSIKSLSVRIDGEMLEELRKIAIEENRSLNSQILVLIRDCIEKYRPQQKKIPIYK